MLKATNKLVLKKEIILKILFSILFPFLIYYNYIIINWQLSLIFYLITVIGLLNIVIPNDFENKVTLNLVFNIFVLVFMSLAPCMQYFKGASFFSVAPMNYEQCFITAKLVFFTLIVYTVVYHCFNWYLKDKLLNKTITINSFFRLKTLYLISFLTGIAFLSIYNFNLSILFFKPYVNYLRLHSFFGVYGYGLSLLLRPIPLIVFYFYVLKEKKRNKNHILLGLCALFFVFPLSLSRALIATYYIPLFIICIPLLQKKYNFSICFFLALFFLFPFLNFFREKKNRVFFGDELINSAHFDSFYNSSYLILNNITSKGEQFFSAFFFFIPESIWENRPMGTGKMLAEYIGYSYTNISMSLWAEGFVNFGIFGVFGSLILLAIFNSFLDVKFYYSKNKTVFFNMGYMFLIGLEFYLLRGDFRSGYSKIIFLNASIFLFFIINRFLNKKFT